VQFGGSSFSSRGAHAETVLANCFFDSISTGSDGLSKAEIIVGCHVETLSAGAGESECCIVVMRDPIEEGDEASGNAGDGTTEAIVDPHLQSTDVKVVKVGIERRVALEIQVSLAGRRGNMHGKEV
jgi:hypothetical protein